MGIEACGLILELFTPYDNYASSSCLNQPISLQVLFASWTRFTTQIPILAWLQLSFPMAVHLVHIAPSRAVSSPDWSHSSSSIHVMSMLPVFLCLWLDGFLAWWSESGVSCDATGSIVEPVSLFLEEARARRNA